VVVVVVPRPESPPSPPPNCATAAISAGLFLMVAQREFKLVLTEAENVPDKSDSTEEKSSLLQMPPKSAAPAMLLEAVKYGMQSVMYCWHVPVWTKILRFDPVPDNLVA